MSIDTYILHSIIYWKIWLLSVWKELVYIKQFSSWEERRISIRWKQASISLPKNKSHEKNLLVPFEHHSPTWQTWGCWHHDGGQQHEHHPSRSYGRHEHRCWHIGGNWCDSKNEKMVSNAIQHEKSSWTHTRYRRLSRQTFLYIETVK